MLCHLAIIINSLGNHAPECAFSNRAAAWPAGAFSSHTARAGLAFAECALGYSAGYAGVVFTECAFGNTPSVHLAIRRACIWQYAERAFGNTPDVHLANTPRVPFGICRMRIGVQRRLCRCGIHRMRIEARYN